MDDIFSEEESEQPEVVAEVTETPEQEAPDPERPRDANGRFAPKGETDGASPAPEAEGEPAFDHAAVKGERARRQAAEAERDAFRSRLEALEQQFTANQQQQQPPPGPAPSLWEDETAWAQDLQSQAVNQSTLHARVMMSEMLAARENPDFTDIKAEYLRMEAENPALIPQVMNSTDPWGTAVRIVKNARAMRDLGATDLATLEAKLRDQIKAEMAQQAPAPAPAIPNSLAGAQSSRGAGTVPQGPAPYSLEDILGR